MIPGYVYVLKNRAFKEVKIGRTTKKPEERANDLSGTGSPHPFKVAYSVYVSDCRTVEQKVHEHLADYRLCKDREFFKVSVEEAKAAIENIIQLEHYSPEAALNSEDEPEELPRLADCTHNNPHHTQQPTNRFAEYILRGKKGREIEAAYPLILASLHTLSYDDTDPEQSGDWSANYKRLEIIHHCGNYGLRQCEARLTALLKEGYGIRRGVGYITKREVIHAQLYLPGAGPLYWFKIYPSIHPLCSAARAMQGPHS